jgi:hypothetical protein
MTLTCYRRTWLWLACLSALPLVAGPASAARAQQGNPPAAAAPAPAAAAEPAVGPAAPEPESTAVQAVLETQPTTPAEMTRAAKILADLRRPDLARQFLQKVLAANLDQQQLAQLGEKFGSPMFVGLAARTDLQPEAGKLADAVMAAYNRQLQAPERIGRLIGQLNDPSAEVRYQALMGLQETRGAAVGPMIEALADPSRRAEHANIREALVRLGRDAEGPLMGILERSDPKLMAQAIQVLAQMNARDSVLYLLGPYASPKSDPAVRAAAGAGLRQMLGRLPSLQGAVKLLADQAEEYFDGRRPVRADIDGNVVLWSWNPSQNQCVSRFCPADLAARLTAARLARDAYALAPDDHRVQVLYLATMLEAAACEQAPGKPLPRADGSADRTAAALGWPLVEDTLEYAMAADRPAAAAAAARILGRIGAAEQLLRQGPDPAPLVRAARSPDRRVRLAAVEAIVALGPDGPYPGSSAVPEAIEFLVGTAGRRAALVAGSPAGRAGDLVGMLASAGLETDTAADGAETVRLLSASPDYELVLIDPGIDRPTVDLLVQRLRHDPRTADLRVGLVARDGFYRRAERAALGDPLCLAFARPVDSATFERQMARLSALRPREFVSAAERQQQAAEALRLLARLSASSQDRKLYDLSQTQAGVLKALWVPDLSKQAIEVLAGLGTRASQQALVEMASRLGQPLEIRQAAVEGFRSSSQEHGILLSRAEILRQYDRYNQSASMDAGTQKVLGLILDCIEAPIQAAQPAGQGEPKS